MAKPIISEGELAKKRTRTMSFDFRKRQPRSIALFALAVVISSVALGQAVESSFLPGIDFSKYRTYQWVTSQPHPDPDVDAEIKRSIDSQLTKKGLTKTDNKADLTVDYRVALTQNEKWPAFRYNEISPSETVVTVYAGTLVIDFKDQALNRLVWTGRAIKAVDRSSAVRKKQKNLDTTIQRLLNGFPPK